MNAAVLTLLLLVLEGAFYLAYQNPSGPALVRAARDYYLYCDRKTVTYEIGKARPDPEVAYTFHPGEFEFENREYETTYRINSQGLRDDERDLVGPEIVVLGDSHAAGWGVDHDETFASILERETGLTVLNAAVPSYATPRELVMLGRQDTSRLQLVIVQYCENDYHENQVFFESGNQKRRWSEDDFLRTRAVYHQVDRTYYPFKFTRVFFPIWFREALNPSNSSIPLNLLEPRAPRDEAVMFLNTLLNGPVDLTGRKVLVLEIVSYNWNSPAFVRALDSLLHTDAVRNHPRLPEIRTVDVSPVLQGADYFLYDDHMNASGHAKVAAELLPVVREMTGGPGAIPARLYRPVVSAGGP